MNLSAWCRFILTTVVLVAGNAQAAGNLSSLLTNALAVDPDFAAAKAAFEAESEARAIGRAGLLPTVSLGLTVAKDDLYRRDLTARVGGSFSNDAQSLSLRLSQPLFDLGRWAAYQEGDVRATRAEIVFADARQDLILRVAIAYFNYLLARDTFDLAQAQKAALDAQRTQAENLFKSGVAVLTDVEETKSRHQLSVAQALVAQSSLELRRNELVKMTGELPAGLLSESHMVPVLMPPEGALESWIAAARAGNLKALAQRLVIEISSHQQSASRAEYLPAVALVASHQKSRDNNYFTARETVTEVGVQLSMNLFAGGSTSAKVRQAEAQRERSYQEMESLTRDAEIKVSQAYREIVNGIAQVSAYEQAVKSAETALQGMKVGQTAGLRTNTDVLNALQQLFVARRDLQKERYTYLVSHLTLQASVGGLSDAQLVAVDGLIRWVPKNSEAQ